MSDRDPRDRRPGTGSKSSGDAGASEGSIFEILDAPLPSEIARDRGIDEPPPRRVAPDRYDTPTSRASRSRPPRQTAAAEPGPGPLSYAEPPTEAFSGTSPRGKMKGAAAVPKERLSRARGAGTTRRVRRVIKHIDPISVLRISLLFYAFFLLVWLIGVAIFYRFLDGLGLFDQLESLGKDLVLPALQNDITLGSVEKWALVIGIICAIVGSLVNAFLAFLYNLISDLIGGIQVTFTEREQ